MKMMKMKNNEFFCFIEIHDKMNENPKFKASSAKHTVFFDDDIMPDFFLSFSLLGDDWAEGNANSVNSLKSVMQFQAQSNQNHE
jgi:hypothetical protein